MRTFEMALLSCRQFFLPRHTRILRVYNSPRRSRLPTRLLL